MQRAELQDGGVRVTVLSLGARVQDWQVPLRGRPRSVVLGHADPEAYRRDPFFLGAIVGRVANRIGGARYVQDGRPVTLAPNEGANQLHGGAQGLWAQEWRLETDGPRRLRLTHDSPAGAMGYPGRVLFSVTMTLDGPRLTWDMQAEADRETPVSLAQHNYYALGDAVVARIAADRVLHRDGAGIMTGAILPAGDLDCRSPRPLPRDADDFLLFDPARDPAAPVAEITGDSITGDGGLRLWMWSDQPGAQLYSGQGLKAPFAPRAGFCLEPSGLPNAVNVPGFPSVMAGPDRPYRQRLTVEIAGAG